MIRQEAVLENMEHAMEYSVSYNALPFWVSETPAEGTCCCVATARKLWQCAHAL